MKSAFCPYILPIVLRPNTPEPMHKKSNIPNMVAFGKSCEKGSTCHSNVFGLLDCRDFDSEARKQDSKNEIRNKDSQIEDAELEKSEYDDLSLQNQKLLK